MKLSWRCLKAWVFIPKYRKNKIIYYIKFSGRAMGFSTKVKHINALRIKEDFIMNPVTIWKGMVLVGMLAGELTRAMSPNSEGGGRVTAAEAMQIMERVCSALGIQIDLDGDGTVGG